MVVTTSLADGKNPDTVPNPARIVSIPGLSVRATIDGVAPGSGGTSPIYEAAYVSSSEIHMVTSNAILTVDGATGAVLDRRSVDYGIAGGPEFLVVEDSARVITAGVLFAGLRRYVKGRSDVDTIIEFGRQVSALAVDRKNRRLFMATQGSDVQIWDLRADTFMFDLEGMTGYLRRAAWTKDGSRIATASTSSDRIRLIDAVDGSVAENVVNPPWGFPTPAAITFDNDATSLYFTPVGDDGVRRLRRFDLRTSTLDDRFTQRASTVVTSRSTSRVIVLSRDSVFALESGNPQPLVASTIDVCSPWVAVSTRDGRIITSCADSTLRILDGLTGQVLSTVPVSSSVVDILVPASSDGNADVLVLLHYGRTQPDAVDAVIVDASTLQEVSSLSAIGTPFIDGFLGNRIACSRSAEFFAVGQDDGAIAIIERSTRLRVKTLETGGSPVTFITVHPEREWMVAGTADGRVLRLKDPWPKSTSSVVDADVLTPEQLRNADVVQWYLLDGRCVGIGADHHLLYPHQPHVVVARFGNRIKTQLILNGAMR
jgi:WD40 repeat protein